MNQQTDDKQQMAEDRTDWAEDRTILANERTFAGWMRTGLASLGIAIGLQAVFGETEPTWLAKLAASFFIAVGLFIFWAAWKNACAMVARLDAHAAEPVSRSHLGLIATFMVISSITAGVILWLV